MNKGLRIALIVIGILVLAGGLVFAGSLIGRWSAAGFAWARPAAGTWYNSYGPGMTLAPALRSGASAGVGNGSTYGPGMMGGGYGPGMMGRGRGYGPGMMGGGRGYGGASVTPLTTDQAYQAAGKYLAGLNDPDLKIAEVMVFDNNAYVRVVEQSTGIGAFELLVDPATLNVYPEHGPNMMWNLKYGGLNHQQMMGGWMMGYAFNVAPGSVSLEMALTAEQALQAAQQYLDTALPGTQTAADADAFYGYYTIDILRDGKTVGMLSVNGTSGQVFLHTWHGTFIASQDY
jgi:hypothetical protein